MLWLNPSLSFNWVKSVDTTTSAVLHYTSWSRVWRFYRTKQFSWPCFDPCFDSWLLCWCRFVVLCYLHILDFYLRWVSSLQGSIFSKGFWRFHLKFFWVRNSSLNIAIVHSRFFNIWFVGDIFYSEFSSVSAVYVRAFLWSLIVTDLCFDRRCRTLASEIQRSEFDGTDGKGSKSYSWN